MSGSRLSALYYDVNQRTPTSPAQPGADLLDAAEAARVVGVHPMTITKWARSGRLRSVEEPRQGRAGRPRRMFERADVEALRDARAAIVVSFPLVGKPKVIDAPGSEEAARRVIQAIRDHWSDSAAGAAVAAALERHCHDHYTARKAA